MALAHSGLKQIVVLLLFLDYGWCDDDEQFIAGFSKGLEDCKNFDNNFLLLGEMYLSPIEDDEYEDAGLMAISGKLKLENDLDDSVMMSIDIVKKTDQGNDPMFSAVMGVCDAIKDKDAPWAPAFEALGWDGCPIKAGTYDVNDIKIKLDFADEFLTHQYCGDYPVVMSLADQQKNEVSCHSMGVSVIEV